VSDLISHSTHPGVCPRSGDQCQFQNRSLIGRPAIQPLEICYVSKDQDVVRTIHHTFINAGYVEITDLDLFTHKISQKLITDLKVKHFSQPQGNRHTKPHCVGLGLLLRNPLKQNSMDALAFLDYSCPIDGRNDTLHIGYPLYARKETRAGRNRRGITDVVHVNRHQLHVTCKIRDAVPDLVPESGGHRDGDDHDEERDSDGDHRYPSSETEASGYEP